MICEVNGKIVRSNYCHVLLVPFEIDANLIIELSKEKTIINVSPKLQNMTLEFSVLESLSYADMIKTSPDSQRIRDSDIFLLHSSLLLSNACSV